jgi:hypothetical protein
MDRTPKSVELKCGKLGIPSTYAPPVAVAAETPYKEDRARVSDEVWKERYSTLSKKYEKALKENSVVESLELFGRAARGAHR